MLHALFVLAFVAHLLRCSPQPQSSNLCPKGHIADTFPCHHEGVPHTLLPISSSHRSSTLLSCHESLLHPHQLPDLQIAACSFVRNMRFHIPQSDFLHLCRPCFTLATTEKQHACSCDAGIPRLQRTIILSKNRTSCTVKTYQYHLTSLVHHSWNHPWPPFPVISHSALHLTELPF